MATLTTNYSLSKPEGSDKAQISVINADMDKIDEEMKKNADAAAAAKTAADAKQDPIAVDTTPTSGSNNPISSDAVYTINSTLTSSVSTETTRAEAAEKTNSDAIATETARAEAAEKTNTDAITAEVTRAEAAEKTNSDAITTEVSRAEAAEKVNTDAITAEATRAKAAEETLTNRTMYGITRNPTTGHMAIVCHA